MVGKIQAARYGGYGTEADSVTYLSYLYNDGYRRMAYYTYEHEDDMRYVSNGNGTHTYKCDCEIEMALYGGEDCRSSIIDSNCVLQCGSYLINERNFPDEKFRNYLKDKYGASNSYGKWITPEKVSEIDISGLGITNLKGIELFTNLEKLNCSNNKITDFDISKKTKLTELNCSGCGLESLDISKYPDLVSLNCSGNKLVELDIRKNTWLKDLDCSDNSITSLDLSGSTSLINLTCSNNSLKSLDLKQASSLKNVACDGNRINYLDLRDNERFDNFDCGSNPIIGIDINEMPLIASFENLTAFVISGSSFDISEYGGDPSKISNVSGGTFENNIIKPNSDAAEVTYYYQTDSSHKIKCTIQFSVAIDKNNFPDDNFREYILNELFPEKKEGDILTYDDLTKIQTINVDNMKISDLTGIEYFNAVISLSCVGNSIESLYLRRNTNLEEPKCSDSKIGVLELTGLTKIKSLYCYSNDIKVLDLSRMTLLESVDTILAT